MKRFFKSIVAVLLCLSMTVPFGAMSMKTNAAVELPDRPTAATGADKIYISYNSTNTNGTKSSSTGGDTAALAYNTSTIDLWNKLMGITEGSTAKTVLGNSTFTNGGTMVNVAKIAFLSKDFTFPKTTTPLVITSKDGDTSYISRLEDGSLDYMTEAGKNGTQYGMILPGANNTITFEGDVIFKDIVFLNRQSSTSTDTPTIFQAGGRFVIESSVEFASMTGNKKFTLDVTKDGCAFIDTLGFGKYTGTGTIVIGDDILASVKEAGRAANFADFEGRIVDKDGNAVFGEPTFTADNTVIYVTYDKNNGAGLTLTPATDGGDTETTPLKASGDWASTSLYTKAANGAKIVAVGKFYAHGSYTFPETTSPIMITAIHNGKDYTSRNSDGSILYQSSTGGNAGQYGMFMINHTAKYTLTFNCDVIFDNIVILNRMRTTSNDAYKPTIAVNKSMVITSTVQFAKMDGGHGYDINIAEGAYLYLHADADGFDSYTGTGTIVIGDEILYSVTEDMFTGFEGKIVDEYGRAINFDELTTAPEDTTTEAPESESSTPESESSAPESESSTPESESSTPESESSTPESDTETPEDTTVPDDTEEELTIPERPTAPSNKVYISYDGNTNLEGAAPSVDGGASALEPYHTKSGTWGTLLTKDIAKNGATFVLVGKGFFGNNCTFTGKDNTYVFTGKDGDANYISMDGDEILYTDAEGASHVGQYGMFIVNPDCTVTFESNVIFKDTVILNRQTAGVSAAKTAPILSVKNILVIEDSVQFASMNGNVKYTLNVEDGAFAFLDALGFGKYTGTGTIVLSDALAATAKKADFAGFEGKVVNKDGIEIFPGSAPSYPSKNNYVYIALNKTQAGGDTDVATEDGGAAPEVPYATSTTNWKNIFSTKLPDGGYVVVVGKGYFGASCELPATSKPIVITAMNMDGTTSYISTNEDGSLNLTNANPSAGGGQYGMFLLNNSKSGYTLTFNGDVIFENIVILNRIATADVEKGIITSTIEVNKTLTIRDTVQFANLSGGKNYNLKVNEGATAYLDAAQFDSYSGSGTIVFGDNLKGVITKDNLDLFKDFTGKVVDKDGNDWFVTTDATGDCTYVYDELTKVLIIKGNGSPAGLWPARYATEIIFEEGVTAVPQSFCLNNTTLKSVTLSSSIKSIDAYAFYGTSSLTTVNIPSNSNIESVGKKAFLFSSITEIKFNDNLKSIGEGAFRGCNDLVSVELGNNVESFAPYSFGYTTKLESFSFNGTITSIPDCCFIESSALTSIIIPNSVTSFGIYSFADTSALTTIDFPDALISIGKSTFNKSGISGTVTLPATVTQINDMAFYQCKSLTTVVLPESITTLGDYCFGQSSITSIELPASISVIPTKIFYQCNTLSSVTMKGTIVEIKPYAFAESGITSFTIPSGCTTLGNAIFYNCTSLTSVTIEDAIKEIPYKTFYNCTSLTNVSLPASLKSIGNYAFYNCTSLTSITLPDGLESIGGYSYAYTALEEITIPEGVATIPTKAFHNCASLTNVNINGAITAIGNHAFSYTSITSFTIPESCTTLGNAIFHSCKKLATVDIQAPIKAITSKMFYECRALKNINIPDSVISIQPYGFYNCSALTSIDLPANLKYLYNHAFAGTTNLAIDLHIPSTLTTPPDTSFTVVDEHPEYKNATIGYYCFNNSGIKSVTFDEGIESIGWAAFYGCDNLTTDIVIPESCTRIDGKAFAHTPIASVSIPSTVTEIGTLAFYVEGTVIDLHTETTAEVVIAWANENNTKVTLNTDYIPASKVTE